MAADIEAAAILIGAVVPETREEVAIDVPDFAPELSAHCAALGLAPSFETTRMYRGAPLEVGESIYAVGTLELG
ncbi:GNAT family N-acetyltransferase [Jannaschia ovalis]|uniref:YitH/HolE acetyltransferase (GNAT) domain-containing protein n=1 Tax=Jannaschia ovalis TaxID=3038773 RepID=A0ABY8LGM2_9RHOB|nr:hypothetical protein [Jannaschia sp. GRR-S6-38]WGH79500.1 hypothetical protein P8627_04335 [Jannaschia sp. GRR-S6-38]